MGKSWRHLLIISPVVIFITLAGLLLFYPVPSPPEKEVMNARIALSAAGKDNAEKYAGYLYHEAKNYYDSTIITWRKENSRFIYKRNYAGVIKFADLTVEKAYLALEASQYNITELKVTLLKRINTLKGVAEEISKRFSDYPLTQEITKRISKGVYLLEGGEIAYRDGNYLLADEKITEAEYLLASSYEYAHANLKNYFRLYPEWKRWVDSTIAVSDSTNDYSIIVDKYSRKVLVYYDGKKHFEYSAELGKNWVGDKRVRGDKATPEGMYKITRKFKSDSTIYYKALLINYPNDEDTANFEAAIARGSLPRSSKIGGMIEIHGHGGKGIDWTEGCIALTDREMDSIFTITKVGTPVTIVGSMYDLRHVLKR